MAKIILGATHKGLKDWVIQRLTAIYILLYVVFISVIIFVKPADFFIWRIFWFHNIWLLIANILFLLAVIYHAWIGAWTVITDYIKPSGLRALVKIVVWLLLFACFIYGVVLFNYLFWSRGF